MHHTTRSTRTRTTQEAATGRSRGIAVALAAAAALSAAALGVGGCSDDGGGAASSAGGRGTIPQPVVEGLPVANLELMPEHHQLDVLHIRAPATPNKHAEQSPHGEIEEGEDHATDPPNPRPDKTRHK